MAGGNEDGSDLMRDSAGDGDEPISPPMFNEAQALSAFRTFVQALGIYLATANLPLAQQTDSLVNLLMAGFGLALFFVTTWWGIRARSTKNLIRDAKHAKRVMRRDAEEKL